jgi:predicted dinucleotide-binding enzyme
MKNVVVVIGAGQIGQAIARRVGVGKHVVLAASTSEPYGSPTRQIGPFGL